MVSSMYVSMLFGALLLLNVSIGHGAGIGPATTYLPQLQQLVISTADKGFYCNAELMTAPASPGPHPSSGTAIKCNLKAKPGAVSFNFLVSQDASFFEPITTIDTTFPINMRPGSGMDSVVFSDGLVMSIYLFPGSNSTLPFSTGMFALETTPGVANLTVLFPSNGARGVYITVPSSVLGQGPMYCRVGDYDVKAPAGEPDSKVVMTNMFVCDAPSAETATLFNVESEGWSWLYKRPQFKSVYTGQMCGNRVFTATDRYITCNGGNQTGVQDWQDDFYDNVLRVPQLPMRSDADFMMQLWFEYPLAFGLWALGNDSFIQEVNFADSVTTIIEPPAGDAPYFAMLKNDGPSRNTTIGSGDRVLLRSSLNRKYCRVVGELARVTCDSSMGTLLAAPDRSVYQFIYSELIPSGKK